MKTKIIVAIVAFAVGIALYFAFQTSQTAMERYGLEGLSTNEMVEKLDRITVDPGELMASVNAETLRIDTEEGIHEYQIEGDVFYLSFAPYIEQTHPCTNHNLSTCRAELAGETFDVLIEDDEEVYFQGEVTAYDNGFKGIWLPRDIEATITVHYDGLSAEADIETSADSPTCLTTLKLE